MSSGLLDLSKLKTITNVSNNKVDLFVSEGINNPQHRHFLPVYLDPVEQRPASQVYTYDEKLATGPLSKSWLTSSNKVRDQGAYGSCVAFAYCAAVEMLNNSLNSRVGYFSPGEFLEGKYTNTTSNANVLSPQFFYDLRTNRDSEGMYLSDANTISQAIGYLPEPIYPYGTTQFSYSLTGKFSNLKNGLYYRNMNLLRLGLPSAVQRSSLNNVYVCPDEFSDVVIKPSTSSSGQNVVSGYSFIKSAQLLHDTFSTLRFRLFECRTLEAAKNALLSSPLVIYTNVYNYSPRYWIGSGKPLGLHCVNIVGYDDTLKVNYSGRVYTGCFILRNQWGTDWPYAVGSYPTLLAGQNTTWIPGHTYFPYADWTRYGSSPLAVYTFQKL